MHKVLLLTTAVACSAGSGQVAGSDQAGDAATGSQRVAAGDIAITKVSLFQGVESVVMENGGEPEKAQAPLLADRLGMLRVHWDRLEGFADRTVVAQLTYDDPEGNPVVQELSTFVDRDSSEPVLSDTFNFDVEAATIGQGFSPTVTLLEESADVAPTGNADAGTWASGALEIEQSDSIDLVIFPIRYDADGSGRLPDTSPEQMLALADKFAATYPVTTINVIVEDPYPVDYALTSSGLGWTELLDELSSLRVRADVRENTYFYGLFEPEPTLAEFCGYGCVLGLAYLAPSTSDDWARVALGTGYSGDVTIDTALQEVGHSHGREHAPCGVSPADPQYPYPDAKIGVMGYDNIHGEMVPPSAKDFMSYCGPVWISDYTYNAILQRVQALRAPNRVAGQGGSWRRVRTDREGGLHLGDAVSLKRPPGGAPEALRVFDAEGGLLAGVTGYAYAYAGLPGGGFWIPDVPGAVSVAR